MASQPQSAFKTGTNRIELLVNRGDYYLQKVVDNTI